MVSVLPGGLSCRRDWFLLFFAQVERCSGLVVLPGTVVEVGFHSDFVFLRVCGVAPSSWSCCVMVVGRRVCCRGRRSCICRMGRSQWRVGGCAAWLRRAPIVSLFIFLVIQRLLCFENILNVELESYVFKLSEKVVRFFKRERIVPFRSLWVVLRERRPCRNLIVRVLYNGM